MGYPFSRNRRIRSEAPRQRGRDFLASIDPSSSKSRASPASDGNDSAGTTRTTLTAGFAVAFVNDTKNDVGSPPLFTCTWIVLMPDTKPPLIVNAVDAPKPPNVVVAAGAPEFSEIEPSLSVPNTPEMKPTPDPGR
jgi:hypothetical protein